MDIKKVEPIEGELETALEITSEESFTRRLTSRKFITMNILQSLWIGLFLLGRLSESGLIELTTVTVGAYFIANAATHFAKK